MGQCFRSFQPTTHRDGMSRAVGSRCLHQGRSWKLNARKKLVSRSSGDPVVCDSSDDSSISFAHNFEWPDTSPERQLKTSSIIQSLSSWFADASSDYDVEVAVSDALAASDVVVIAIRRHVQLGMEGLGG
jgi:hypothetical protein